MSGETLLLRQVHPTFVQEGRFTSQAFRPTPKDKGKLSADDGSRTTAIEAWTHFTEIQKFQSSGVAAVTVDECKACGLPAGPDERPGLPYHCSVDFSGHPDRVWRPLSKQLQMCAEERGWQHKPLEAN